MLYDFLGESVWILLYGGLGYAFGSQWEVVSDFISNFGGLVLGIAVLGVGIWMAKNWQEKLQQETQETSLEQKIPRELVGVFCLST